MNAHTVKAWSLKLLKKKPTSPISLCYCILNLTPPPSLTLASRTPPTPLHVPLCWGGLRLSTIFTFRPKQWPVWIFTHMWIDYLALLTVAAESDLSIGPTNVASRQHRWFKLCLPRFCRLLFRRCLTSPGGLSSRGLNKGPWRMTWGHVCTEHHCNTHFQVLQMYFTPHAVFACGLGCVGVGGVGVEKR